MVGKVRVDVPSLYELLVREPHVYGLLVGDENKLLYVPSENNFENLSEIEMPVNLNEAGHIIIVKRFSNEILSVFATDNEVYVGLDSSGLISVVNNSSNFYIFNKYGWKSLRILDAFHKLGSIEDIIQLGPGFDKKIVIVGICDIFSDVYGNQFIPFKEFKKKNIYRISNIVYDDNDSLFLEVEYSNSKERDLVRVIYEEGKFEFGEEVLHYNIKNRNVYRSRFLGKDEDGNPLVISTVPLKYLVINNEKVVGSEVSSPTVGWTRFDIFNRNPKERIVKFFVSGYSSNVEYMVVDYKNLMKPVVVERRRIITSLSSCRALGVVRSEKLHEMLMSLKGKG